MTPGAAPRPGPRRGAAPRTRVGAAIAPALLVVALGARAVADAPVTLPDAPGRELVAHACAQCHSLETVTHANRTRKQWEALLDTMIARGARVSDEDFDRMAEYLASQFGLPPKE